MTIKTLLISSVGSLVGQNILDALEQRRQRLRIIGVNSEAGAGNNFRCDRTYLLPPAAQAQAYRQALAGVIEAEAVDLVIPGRDADVIVLSQLRAERPEWARRLLVGTLAAAQVMDDKVASYQFAQQAGLPFAPTVSSDAADARLMARQLLEQFGFPMIAKPRHGDGSRGIRVLTQASHLEHALQQPGMAIQPMLDTAADLDLDLSAGLPFFWAVPETRLYGVQTLILPNGDLGPGFGFISSMVTGRCERLSPCVDADLLSIAHDFSKAMAKIGWRGPFNLQLKRDPRHGLQAIEMNGRFSGGTSARRHLGFDEVALTLNQWLHGTHVPVLAPPVGINSVVNRSLSDFPVSQADHHTLQQERVWPRSC
jgi:carbamoyl-phosphate synthase large subunit